MKKLMAICTVAILGTAGFAAAQGGTMPQTGTSGTMPQSGTMKMDHDMSKEMKVTGCVAESSDMGHFMLNNAMMSDMKSGDMKSGDTMKGHDMKSMDKPMSYTLMGGEMKPHVGHKVEVTGTMGAGKMQGKDTPTPDAMPKESNAMNMADMHTLNVKSVKMISPNCQ